MEEVGPIEQIETIIKNSQGDDGTSNEDGTAEPEPAPEETEEPEDDGVVARTVPAVEETVGATVEDPANETLYSGTAAGSASPSA
jgi:hypothetical protein